MIWKEVKRMRVYHRLSGIVGVVRKVTRKGNLAAVFCLLMLFSVAAPGVASAQPDAPPTPTITVVPEEPAPAPAPDTGSDTPSGPPVGNPEPAPAPAPPPPPPAVDPVPAPAPAPPAPIDPAPAEVPPAVPAEPPATGESPTDGGSLPEEGDTETELPAQDDQVPGGEAESGQPPASQPDPTDPGREGQDGTGTGEPSVGGSDEGSQEGDLSTPGDNGSVPDQPNGNSSEGSTPSGESGQEATGPDPSGQPEVVTEELSTPATVVPEPEAQLVSMEALKKVEQPAETKEASPEVVEEALVSLAEAARVADRDNDDRDRDRGNDGRDRDHPRDHDPKGWKCDDRRGAYGCPWDQWGYDDRGRPEFYNRFSFDLKVLYWDGYTNVEVIVRAGTRQWIDPRNPGAYAFVVVGVSNPDFRLNVGVGVFNSGNGHGNGNCGINPRYCDRPSVTEINVFVSVTNTRYDRLRAYDCGCRTRYMDRDYDRVYIGGSREVIGYWNPPRTQFRPHYIRENPTSPAYVPVTQERWNDVVDGGDPKGGDPTQAAENVAGPEIVVDRSMQYALTAAAIVVIIGSGLLLRRHFRRQDES